MKEELEKASLLLVDDSPLILAFEKAALSGFYRIATASHGEEALQRLSEARPDALVLDLSMPVMDGDEVLRRVRADEALRDIGILILSTEGQRARDCLSYGADGFLLKPSKPEELRAHVAAVLEQAERRTASRQRAILFFRVGELELGLNLAEVEQVLSICALSPLPGQPDWVMGWFELYGEACLVIDFATLAGSGSGLPWTERKLLVLRHPQLRLALCVDRVRDPEELDQASLSDSSQLLPQAAEVLRKHLDCMARSAAGALVPVLKGSRFFDDGQLVSLASHLKSMKV